MSNNQIKHQKKTSLQIDNTKSPVNSKKLLQCKGNQSALLIQRSNTLNEVTIQDQQQPNKSEKNNNEQETSNSVQDKKFQSRKTVKILDIFKLQDNLTSQSLEVQNQRSQSNSQNELKTFIKKNEIQIQRKQLFQIIESNITEECQSGLLRDGKKPNEYQDKKLQENVSSSQNDLEIPLIKITSLEQQISDISQTPKAQARQSLKLGSKSHTTIHNLFKSINKKLDLSILESPQIQLSQNMNFNQTKLSEDSRGNTKVVVRFRPENEVEQQIEKQENCKLEFPFQNSVIVIDDGIPYQFTLDKVFPMETEQSDIFEFVGIQTCQDVLDGYNGTIFAYGQTGSGKTFTMMGLDIHDDEKMGIIPRSVNFIFESIQNQEFEVECIIKCSMLEIYKEMLRDLIDPDTQTLKIKESPENGIYVEGLLETCVSSVQDVLELIDLGNEQRAVAATGMNKNSSRSHSLFIMQVQQKWPNGSERIGKLNLVDLAGSEKIRKSKVEGEGLEEAKKINLSLSALGNVIHALTSNSEHIPYRDSKLTRLLQHSLGGNYKTSLIISCSPHPRNFEETLTTLKFAQRAKYVKNKPLKNIKRSAAYYQKIIEELKQELSEYQQKYYNLQQQYDSFRKNTEESVTLTQLSPDLKNQIVRKENLNGCKDQDQTIGEYMESSQSTLIQFKNSFLNQENSRNENSIEEIKNQNEKNNSNQTQYFMFPDLSNELQNNCMELQNAKELLEMKLMQKNNEIENLKNEKEDMKFEIKALQEKNKQIELDLIDYQQSKLQQLQAYEKLRLDHQREIQQKELIIQEHQILKQQFEMLTQFMVKQDQAIQKMIAGKIEKLTIFNQIDLQFVKDSKESCKKLVKQLNYESQHFSLNLKDLLIEQGNDYLEMLKNNIQDNPSYEQLKYRHREIVLQQAFYNIQLISILNVLQ